MRDPFIRREPGGKQYGSSVQYTLAHNAPRKAPITAAISKRPLYEKRIGLRAEIKDPSITVRSTKNMDRIIYTWKEFSMLHYYNRKPLIFQVLLTIL